MHFPRAFTYLWIDTSLCYFALTSYFFQILQLSYYHEKGTPWVRDKDIIKLVQAAYHAVFDCCQNIFHFESSANDYADGTNRMEKNLPNSAVLPSLSCSIPYTLYTAGSIFS